MIIPTDITSKHSLVHEHVFRQGPNTDGLQDAIFELATLANDHLVTSRSMFHKDKVPAGAVPIFMAGVCNLLHFDLCGGADISGCMSHTFPQVPVAGFLQRLQNSNFNVFDPRLQVRDWKMPWRLWKNYHLRVF
jgi:NADH dehydrogenase [ubiquinone] 1 alpha subcomplex assembly factor 6